MSYPAPYFFAAPPSINKLVSAGDGAEDEIVQKLAEFVDTGTLDGELLRKVLDAGHESLSKYSDQFWS